MLFCKSTHEDRSLVPVSPCWPLLSPDCADVYGLGLTVIVALLFVAEEGRTTFTVIDLVTDPPGPLQEMEYVVSLYIEPVPSPFVAVTYMPPGTQSPIQEVA